MASQFVCPPCGEIFILTRKIITNGLVTYEKDFDGTQVLFEAHQVKTGHKGVKEIDYVAPDPTPDTSQVGVLSVSRFSIPADGVTETVLRYGCTGGDCVYVLNGVPVPTDVVDGIAQLHITADRPGAISVLIEQTGCVIVVTEVQK